MRRERGRTSSLLCAQSVALGGSLACVWICASRACAALAATRSATAARNGQGLLSGRAARQPRQPLESAVCRGRRPTTSCGRGPGHSARLPRRSPRKYTRRERAHRLRAQYRRERGRTSSLLCAQSVAVGVSSARVWSCASLPPARRKCVCVWVVVPPLGARRMAAGCE